MQTLSHKDLFHALEAVGIERGDRVLIHSSTMAFGRPEKGIHTFLDCFRDLIGESGVIAAPTFSFSVISKGVYHYRDTKSAGMGALNEAIRTAPDAFRTHHPLQSVAMIGEIGTQFQENHPYSAYEEGATFDLMVRQGFKVVCLGVPPKFISHSHLSEERNKVPYRFMKQVAVQAVFEEGEENIVDSEWGFYARHLDIPIYPHKEDEIVDELRSSGKWYKTSLNGALISSGYASDFVKALDAKLEVNPYWTLDNPEEVQSYLKGK